MAYQIKATIWIYAETHDGADEIYDKINSMDGVADMDWLDGEVI